MAIQKVLPTRNLWLGQPQDAGAESAASPKSKNHKEVGCLAERMFMRVGEVAEALDVSKPYAYRLIRELNEELRRKGCITIAGRIDRMFFYEKFYGARKNN